MPAGGVCSRRSRPPCTLSRTSTRGAAASAASASLMDARRALHCLQAKKADRSTCSAARESRAWMHRPTQLQLFLTMSEDLRCN